LTNLLWESPAWPPTPSGFTSARFAAIMAGIMPDPEPYTHVRLICSNDGGLNHRYEIRVSTFVQFDDNPGRRSITGHPSKEEAERIAKKIARAERDRIGAPVWK